MITQSAIRLAKGMKRLIQSDMKNRFRVSSQDDLLKLIHTGLGLNLPLISTVALAR